MKWIFNELIIILGFSKSQILWLKNIDDDEFFNVFNDIFQWQQKIHFFYWCLHNRIILVNVHLKENWAWDTQKSVETDGTVESFKLKVKKLNENRFEWWLNWWARAQHEKVDGFNLKPSNLKPSI